MTKFAIDGREIGLMSEPFIIAEAGINHNGDLARAIEMVRAAKEAGADAVKFQTFKADELVADPDQIFQYRSQGRDVAESMLEMFRRYELPKESWERIKAECLRAGIVFFSSPQNRSDLNLLLEVGVPAVKVGSDDFVNLPLLRSYAGTGLPLILSCGMSNLAEVYTSLEAVGAFDGYPVALLLCTSQYPTPPSDVNVRKLQTLQAAFPDLAVGFSDHTRGNTAAGLALALGARIFEKHFTLDNDLPGPDHWFSENPASLRLWVQSIRDGYQMLGSAIVRPTEIERANLRDFRRFLVAATQIKRGDSFSEKNLTMRRHPGGQLPPSEFDRLIGKPAPRSYAAGEPIE